MAQPNLITVSFASSATPDLVNEIPINVDPSDPENKASWSQGFSQITMTAQLAGGLPPFGQDFNGVLKSITENIQFMCGGGNYKFDAQWVSEVGGYAIDSIILTDDGLKAYRSKVDTNTVNPNTATGATLTDNWELMFSAEAAARALVSIQQGIADSQVRNNAQLDDRYVQLTGYNAFDPNGTYQGLAANNTSPNDIGALRYDATTALTRDFLSKNIAPDARDVLNLGTAATRDVGTAAGNVAEYAAGGLSGYGYGGQGTIIGAWSDIGVTQFVASDDGSPTVNTHYGFKVVANSTDAGAYWACRDNSFWKSDAGAGQWFKYWDDNNLPSPAVTDASNTFNGNQTIDGNLALNKGVNEDVYLKIAESSGAQGFIIDYLGSNSNDTVFSTLDIATSKQEFLRVRRGSSTVTFTGNVYAANYYPASSDQRLKNKLRPVVIDYHQAAALQSWVFQWKDMEAVPESQRGKLEIGLMAQEIMKVFPPEQYPSLVIKKDNGYYTIDPDKILMMRVFAKVESRFVTWVKDAKRWVNGLLSS